MSDDVIWIVTEPPLVSANPPAAPPSVPPPTAPSSQDTRRGEERHNPFVKSPAPTSNQRQYAIPVQVDKLEQNMTTFLSNMGRVLNRAHQSAVEVAGMELEEIELSVEINGEGQVNLLGSGVKASSKGAMTLKFKAKAK